jgi:hypothetical protein
MAAGQPAVRVLLLWLQQKQRFCSFYTPVSSQETRHNIADSIRTASLVFTHKATLPVTYFLLRTSERSSWRPTFHVRILRNMQPNQRNEDRLPAIHLHIGWLTLTMKDLVHYQEGFFCFTSFSLPKELICHPTKRLCHPRVMTFSPRLLRSPKVTVSFTKSHN